MGLFDQAEVVPLHYPASFRRALNNLGVRCNEVHRILSAAKLLKVEARAPIHYGFTAMAHVGFPKKRVAVLFKSTNPVRDRELAEEWKALGFRLLIVPKSRFTFVSTECVADDLKSVFASKEVLA